MDRNKCLINTQLTLEEDKNITDRNPDASRILLEKASPVFDEIRPGKDQVGLRGRLLYEVLYLSEEGGLYRLQGELPFEEKIRAEGVEPGDGVEVIPVVEDLRTGLINSRKLSIRALLGLCVKAEEIFDEQVPVDVEPVQGLEVQKRRLKQSIVTVDRRDILRIREEMELPANLPPVEEILWESIDLRKWEIRPLENSIGIQGELQLFLLYEAQGEDRPVKLYEGVLPFSSNLECPGSRGGMIPDMEARLSMAQLAIKQDYDGENRNLECEAVLDLPIRLLQTDEWEIITDAYSTTQEVTALCQTGSRKLVRDRYQGRVKLSQSFPLTTSSSGVLQICHVESNLSGLEMTAREGGLEIEGIVTITALYLTQDENQPYGAVKGEIPYSYFLDTSPLTEGSCWKVTPILEQCRGILLDAEHIEVKVQIALEIILSEKWEEATVKELQVQPLSIQKLSTMPGMVVYFAAGGEELWEVGKKYLTPLESIRSLNQLSGDTLEKGQKILVVKEVG